MITVRELADAGCTVIEPGPRLTLENSAELLSIVQAMSPGVSPALIVNLKATRIIDSSGIGILVTVMKDIQSRNGHFVLANLRPEILRMFQLMNLHQVFDIAETEVGAIKQLAVGRV